MSILTNTQIAELREQYPTRKRKPRKVALKVPQKPGPKPAIEQDLCYHWCPEGKHYWSHPPLNSSIAMDEYKKVCRDCARATRPEKISTKISTENTAIT